jgi:hypothetical protein
MIWRRDAHAFSQELQDMLELLNVPGIPPQTGVEALHAFFQAADHILNRCDDSAGDVGHVFRNYATKAFAGFASHYADKPRLEILLEELLLSNTYGACDKLSEHIREMLPGETVRRMISRFMNLAREEPDEDRSFSIRCAADALALGLGDPQLYLQTCTAEEAPPLNFKLLRAARLFLDSGDAAGALEVVNRMSDGPLLDPSKKTRLLIEIHQALRNLPELENLLRSCFFADPSAETLAPLVGLKGEDCRHKVLEELRFRVLGADAFSAQHALFLCQTGYAADVEHYVLERHAAVDGSYYHEILPLLEDLETRNLCLPATVLYRRLIESVLQTANYSAYGHAARYLHKLRELAPRIGDWKSIQPHDAYEAVIRAGHSRKTAFWARLAEVVAKADDKARRTLKKQKNPRNAS